MTESKIGSKAQKAPGRDMAMRRAIDALEAQRQRRSQERLTRGSGDRRFAAALLDAARPSATQEESRATLSILLRAVWDDAEADGQRHVLAMIGAAIKHEVTRWHDRHGQPAA